MDDGTDEQATESMVFMPCLPHHQLLFASSGRVQGLRGGVLQLLAPARWCLCFLPPWHGVAVTGCAYVNRVKARCTVKESMLTEVLFDVTRSPAQQCSDSESSGHVQAMVLQLLKCCHCCWPS
jgi:hypothetical protein